MPTILAIDSSTDICSVALLHEGKVQERSSELPRQHASQSLPMIRQLLADAGIAVKQISAIAVTRGPGSFTGLRIGVAIAQGLAFADDIPLLMLSSLEVMAMQARNDHACRHMLIAMQAREDEIYLAAYEGSDGTVILSGAEEVRQISRLELELPPRPEGWAGVGNAWHESGPLRERYGPLFTAMYPTVYPRAGTLAQLGLKAFLRGDTVAAELAMPVYLKEQEYH